MFIPINIKTLLIILTALLFAASCSKTEETLTTTLQEPVVIRVGTHNLPAWDPSWRDQLTGQPGLSPDEIRIREIALKKVLDELNVKIEWVQYAGSVGEVLLRSVLAGDPLCDIAFLWGGSQAWIMRQNILQDLTPFADIFEGDPETEWMLLPPVFGKRYFFNYKQAHVDGWPLVFNINYIERVDALKENGRTVYPTDLYKQGRWTWSVFEDYLEKIYVHFQNTPSPLRPEIPIKVFQTDWRFASLAMIHSAGRAIYDGSGLEVETPEVLRAIEFLDRLKTRDLIMSVNYDNSIVPGWTWNGNDFANGETVFTDIPFWLMTHAGSSLASRGESVGIIPYPRPDDMAFNDPRSQHTMNAERDCYGILKGISPERARLALEAKKLYYLTILRTRAESEFALDYLTATAEEMAVTNGFDIFHEKIGQDIYEIFMNYSPRTVNEYGGIVDVRGQWEDVVGRSIYGIDGSPKYAVNIARNRNLLENTIAEFEAHVSLDIITAE